MSGDTLRRAAALMRERAEAARTFYSEPHPKAGHEVAWFGPADMYDFDDHDGPHIASWHPAVALAVADLLDRFAYFEPPKTLYGYASVLNVARAYLGETE